MTREEAIEIYKGLINPNIIEAFEVLVPEIKEIGRRRQNMVNELMGMDDECCKYHRIKGMHDAYVDLLVYLDYSTKEKQSHD